MRFDAQSFRDPRLQLRRLRVDRLGHDADRRAAVDLLQPIENRPQEPLVPPGIGHVVDRQHDHGLDARVADPLRSHQPRRVAADPVRIGRGVQVRQTIALVRGSGGRGEQESNQQGKFSS